jgi:hypothetical protein
MIKYSGCIRPLMDGYRRTSIQAPQSPMRSKTPLKTKQAVQLEALRSYIEGLDDLSSEIRAEITEARFWVRYFKKQKGDSRE